jgi:hypothetical protein
MVWNADIPEDRLKYASEQFSNSLRRTCYDFNRLMAPVFGLDEIKIPMVQGDFLFGGVQAYLFKDGEGDFVAKVSNSFVQDVLGFDCETCFERWMQTRSFNLAHELGHVVHSIVNPDVFQKGADERKSGECLEHWLLGEVISELSAYVFFDKKGKLGSLSDFPFCSQEGNHLEVEYDYTAMAFKLLQKGKNTGQRDVLLDYLMRSDLKDGQEVIEPFRDSLKNIYSPAYFMYFGMCEHEDNGRPVRRDSQYTKQLILPF